MADGLLAGDSGEVVVLATVARTIEGLLSLGIGPIGLTELAEFLELEVSYVEEAIDFLATDLVEHDRATRVVKVANGYALKTAPDLAGVLGRFLSEDQSPTLSAAAMEALAVVAYLQPVSRAQVSEIRGVSSDGVIRLLVDRGLIEGDRRRGRIGEPILFRTTQLFLERFGLDDLTNLPALADFVPSGELVEVLEESRRNR
ncbi:SMC-Scp complex subunit ScpB [Ferrimicrobium acidiphilum]|uniref:SMC-Scp complex subunit ScpB n=1 Tax=Ferrimicrobium acidiphilum TaxID=121039 RepID=UPI0023F4B9DB|nr:SMC-Scp complex subunit ScpB [Ferrimicrobium acidiphilum]MCL5052340.1 SMC-Scp complex subunit ScpB [Gammaproteobacteria bacterium]